MIATYRYMSDAHERGVRVAMPHYLCKQTATRLEQQEQRIAALEKDLGEEWAKRQIESHKALQKQIELERELAAAKEDLRHNDNCDICIGSMTAHAECDLECLTCRLDCRCKDCNDENNKWAWRGAQEGEER